MYDSDKIIPGLIIFVGLMTFPIWSSIGKAEPKPEPKIDTPAINQMVKKQCVEDTHFMKTSHMQMINDWRDKVLRDGERYYTNSRGEKVMMSLQNTCMKCHSNKDKFCDTCHTYTDVKPYCWDCHIQPKGVKQ
jgi:hypothetical protein